MLNYDNESCVEVYISVDVAFMFCYSEVLTKPQP